MSFLQAKHGYRRRKGYTDLLNKHYVVVKIWKYGLLGNTWTKHWTKSHPPLVINYRCFPELLESWRSTEMITKHNQKQQHPATTRFAEMQIRCGKLPLRGVHVYIYDWVIRKNWPQIKGIPSTNSSWYWVWDFLLKATPSVKIRKVPPAMHGLAKLHYFCHF